MRTHLLVLTPLVLVLAHLSTAAILKLAYKDTAGSITGESFTFGAKVGGSNGIPINACKTLSSQLGLGLEGGFVYGWSSITRKDLDTWSNALYLSAPSASIQTSGQLVSWQVYIQRAGYPIYLQIWRRVQGLKYKLINEVRYKSTTTGAKTIIPTTPLDVNKGDIIGFFFPDKSVLPFTAQTSTTGGKGLYLHFPNANNIKINSEHTFQVMKDSWRPYRDYSVSFIVKPAKDHLYLYQHANYKGTVVDFTKDSNVPASFNDLASSAKITGTSSWKIFQHYGYGGSSTILKPGNYPNWSKFPGNDVISSIKKLGPEASGDDAAVACSGAKADIVFVVDSSGSVGKTNFNKMKDFVKKVTDALDVGKDATRVGLLTYNTNAKIRFGLDAKPSKSDVQAAIDALNYTSGMTNTGGAIASMVGMFTGRKVPKVGVVITDGRSNTGVLTVEASAKTARDSGVTLVAVGIGNGIKEKELNQIASDPDSTHRIMIKDFEALIKFTKSLAKMTCGAAKTK